MIPLLDLDAPIVSGGGLAGLKVGSRLKRYRGLLNAAHDQYGDSLEDDTPDWCHFWMEPWAVRYRLGQVYEQTDEEFSAMTDAVMRGDWDEAAEGADSPETIFDPAVELYADVRSTRVYMVAALPRYGGSFHGVRPGMTVGEAVGIEPKIHYDEALDMLQLPGDEGIGFRLSESDPEPDEVPGLVIETIEIYARRLTTYGGIAF